MYFLSSTANGDVQQWGEMYFTLCYTVVTLFDRRLQNSGMTLRKDDERRIFVQKENEFKDCLEQDNYSDRATPENQTEPSGGTDRAKPNPNPSPNPDENENFSEFEELIKGPYKDAFSKKVQAIINKRFKEQKNAQSGTNQTQNEPLKAGSHIQNTPANKGDEKDIALDTLLNAGIDYNTAYSVLHLDEILEDSAKRGAELAAKSITDGIRYKAARPTEAVVSAGGYSAKSSVSALTPEKRRELAKKAMLGEKIGF